MAARPKRAKAAQPKPQMYRCQRYGILNPYGDVWTPDTFDSPEKAEEHIKQFWGVQAAHQFPKFKVVQVRVTVSPIQS